MILEDVVEFFREVPPLSFLEPWKLRRLAKRAALDFFPKGSKVLGPGGTGVLGQGGAGDGFVLVVRKGRISSQGENYLEGSLLGWTAAEAGAAEDAVCCLLPPEAVSEALGDRPELFDFLEERLSAQVLEMGLAGLVRRIPDWLDRRPLASVTAGEAARPGDPLPPGTTIQQAARIMTETCRDAVVVLGGGGRASGMVTDRDFRERVALAGLAPDTPVEGVMTSPVVSVDAGASCFEALMAMTRHHIRHVVVMAGLKPVGVLSAQELLLRQVGSPPALASMAAGATTVRELAGVAALLDGLALSLLREGARASELGSMVGGLREALAARACQLAEEKLGPPPSAYTVMLLGRAARREGPAMTPLWNAVVYEQAPGAKAWCEGLGRFLGGALDGMRLAPEAGAPSAASPQWRGTPEVWMERLDVWVKNGPPDTAGAGCLDFRPVHGQARLVETLRAQLLGFAGLAELKELSRQTELAGFRSCRLESDPGQTFGQISGRSQGPDCEQDLAGFLVETVRSWSLSRGITRIASVERAKALDRLCAVGPELTRALEYLTARQWIGGVQKPDPLARAMERMCRRAAGRARDEMVA
jgi:CBS domain-containing protein